MSIMSAKYKAHKLVNIVFYLIIFVFGFLVGIGAKKININALFSKVLMIDSVNAYTIATANNTAINEEFIYNGFSQNSSFDINEFPYIMCRNESSTIYCYAIPQALFDTFYVPSGSISNTKIDVSKYAHNSNILLGTMYIRKSDGAITFNSFSNANSSAVSNFLRFSWGFQQYYSYTNFNPSLITGADTRHDEHMNKLDFSQYSIPEMVYDENLFANDSNFKEVCVNNYDTFSITSNEIQDYDNDNNPQYHSFDFMWFKNGVKGISTYLYDSDTETHVTLFEQQQDGYLSSPYGWYFWLNSQEEIDTYWNSPNSPGLELTTKGYTDKYKYYNYTLYPFTMTFTTDYHRYQVFWFKNAYIEDLEGNKTYPDKYCFYIKNNYDVNIINKNSYGDIYTSPTVLGGITFDDKTYENELSEDVEGLFSTVTHFISRMSSTIVFINTNIFNLYTSMPLIVRLFIMTFLTLVVIKILIGMVIK